jgi:hypothetical protein
MSEANNLSGEIGLARPLSRGSRTIGFALSTDHIRQNTRTFTIDDTFERLLDLNEQDYCESSASDPTYTNMPDYDYPVAGQTRLDETLRTFLDLNQSGNLGTKPNGSQTPTLTDDLQFTTKYSGSVSPGYSFNLLGPAFEISNALGKYETSREDLHRVTIVLALPPKGAKPTALTIAETRQQAQQALAKAYNNRNQISLERIADRIPSIFP